MKKILFLVFMLISSNLWAYPTESGGRVVSANETIVRGSIEATTILQSDTLSNLYGVTVLGGASNYVSVDAGGVIRTTNVVSSANVHQIGNDQYITWRETGGRQRRIGLTTGTVFNVQPPVDFDERVSGEQLSVASIFTTSINTTHIRVSGQATLTSSYSTGTCSFTFNNGLLTVASC